MTPQVEDMVRSLSPAKALTVCAYGESVAAYRYRSLAEKAGGEELRRAFTEVAQEEARHHAGVQALLERHFPGSDYVLSKEDKELVIVGPRTFEVGDREALRRALVQIHESELQTGRFYTAFATVTERRELRPYLQEMARECFRHAERIQTLQANG